MWANKEYTNGCRCRQGVEDFFLLPLHFFYTFIIFRLKVMDMNDSMSIILYKEGTRKARLLSYQEAFDDYASAFLQRLHLSVYSLEFVSFYRYQLARYLKAKPVFTLSLPEGDMISDLIKDAYDCFVEAAEESPFNITDEGRLNLLESVRICFPWQNDPDSLSDAQ